MIDFHLSEMFSQEGRKLNESCSPELRVRCCDAVTTVKLIPVSSDITSVFSGSFDNRAARGPSRPARYLRENSHCVVLLWIVCLQ